MGQLFNFVFLFGAFVARLNNYADGGDALAS
jgi:hypothetical protein